MKLDTNKLLKSCFESIVIRAPHLSDKEESKIYGLALFTVEFLRIYNDVESLRKAENIFQKSFKEYAYKELVRLDNFNPPSET